MRNRVMDFIGKANYTGDLGTYIWGNNKAGKTELIAIIEGYREIQELCTAVSEANDFQDEMGRFIAEAINEKIHKESNKDCKFIDYNLSVRLLNCLYEHKFRSPIELIEYTKNDIIGLRNFGIKSQNELFKFMNEYNFKFKGE